MQEAVAKYPNVDLTILKDLRTIELEFQKAGILLNGDQTLAEKEREAFCYKVFLLGDYQSGHLIFIQQLLLFSSL